MDGAELTELKASPQRENILGIGVSVVDMSRALGTIQGWIDRGGPSLRVRHGRTRLMVSQGSSELRRSIMPLV